MHWLRWKWQWWMFRNHHITQYAEDEQVCGVSCTITHVLLQCPIIGSPSVRIGQENVLVWNYPTLPYVDSINFWTSWDQTSTLHVYLKIGVLRTGLIFFPQAFESSLFQDSSKICWAFHMTSNAVYWRWHCQVEPLSTHDVIAINTLFCWIRICHLKDPETSYFWQNL